VKYTDPKQWIAFDVETSGLLDEHALQPWADNSWLTSFATARVSSGVIKTSVFPSDSSAAKAEDFEYHLKSALENFVESALQPATIVVGWNVAFDAAWLIKYGYRKEVMRINWLDGMSLWKHCVRVPESTLPQAKRKSFGLKAAVGEFLPAFAGYDDGVSFHDMDDAAIDARLKYNKLDAGLTLRLTARMMSRLAKQGNERQLRSALVEAKSVPLVADHYMTGIATDMEALKTLGAEVDKERQLLEDELGLLGAAPAVLSSPAQLQSLLFDDWGLPVIKETDKGNRSTDKEVLYELSFMDDRVDKIKRYRELKGLKTKFVDNIVASCEYNEDGRSHPTAFINSTYTGRMTYASSIGKGKAKRQTGFALHQMKRAAIYRRTICAPEGYTLVEWDAASQEYRWVAIESGDETMLSMCEAGQDPHSFMASEMTSLTYEEMREAYQSGSDGAYEQRMAGKVANLSCQYRIGPKSLLSSARVQYGLDWDIDKSTAVHGAYHRTYQGVKKYWARKIRAAQALGYAETIAGRRVQLSGDWGGADTKWRLESSAINFPIQGIGADQKYLAMAALKPLLSKYCGSFYFELHDGLFAIFPNKVVEKAAHEGQRLLSNLPYDKVWGFHSPIPLPWDCMLGPNWGDLKELNYQGAR
jgi:DNA polymerase I-like protein with 3'-5' exonuclease and polymerase domains